MQAILTKPLKHGVKTITGTVLCRGLGVITLLVADAKGGHSTKRFKESSYTVTLY